MIYMGLVVDLVYAEPMDSVLVGGKYYVMLDMPRIYSDEVQMSNGVFAHNRFEWLKRIYQYEASKAWKSFFLGIKKEDSIVDNRRKWKIEYANQMLIKQ